MERKTVLRVGMLAAVVGVAVVGMAYAAIPQVFTATRPRASRRATASCA